MAAKMRFTQSLWRPVQRDSSRTGDRFKLIWFLIVKKALQVFISVCFPPTAGVHQ